MPIVPIIEVKLEIQYAHINCFLLYKIFPHPFNVFVYIRMRKIKQKYAFYKHLFENNKGLFLF